MTVGLRAPAPRPVRIAGLGGARPAEVVSAEQLGAPFGRSAGWITQRTGIVQLHRLPDEAALVPLAAEAVRAALADAGMACDAVDAVLVASCSALGPDVGGLSRSVVAAVTPRAVPVDLNAACAGFTYALSAATALVGAGSATTVVVVGAEQMSRLVDPADLGTSILFADGAGAAVVTADPDQRADAGAAMGLPAWSSDAAQADALTIPAGTTCMAMDGRRVFRWAVSEVPAVAVEAMKLAGVAPDDIDIFVPHQANLRIVDALVDRLGLGRATVARDVVTAGNTSAASVPLALTALRAQGVSLTGRLALVAGFGAGLSISAQVVRLP